MKLRAAVPLMALCALAGFASGAFSAREEPKEPEKVIEYVVDNSPAVKRVKISDTLISGLERQQKLIVLEAALEEDVTIDDSFADWEVFRKLQKITVKATGRFTVDLGAIAEGDILFDNYSGQVVIRLARPVIDSVTVDEAQTVFHSVERGLLRFGEIRLTAAEQNEIYARAKEGMTQKLTLETAAEAEAAAKESVRGLADKFLSAAGMGGNDIIVVWD